MTVRVLQYVADWPLADGAADLGCTKNDLNNMRRGASNLTTAIFLKLVRKGRFDPTSIFEGQLRHLPTKARTTGSTPRRVAARVRKIARSMPAKTLGKRTRMSGRSPWTLRYGKGDVHMQWIIALVRAGWSLDYLVFGKLPSQIGTTGDPVGPVTQVTAPP